MLRLWELRRNAGKIIEIARRLKPARIPSNGGKLPIVSFGGTAGGCRTQGGCRNAEGSAAERGNARRSVLCGGFGVRSRAGGLLRRNVPARLRDSRGRA